MYLDGTHISVVTIDGVHVSIVAIDSMLKHCFGVEGLYNVLFWIREGDTIETLAEAEFLELLGVYSRAEETIETAKVMRNLGIRVE